MHDHKLVSVIIPCYNAEKWVADAINGILRQTYSPIEIIVIDDGSTDGSLDVIRSFGDRVHYETGPSRGGSAARNRGFALSRGKYVMFHDADDWISEDTIARLVAGIQDTKNTLTLCDWYISFPTSTGSRDNQPGYITGKEPPSPDPFVSWLEGWRPTIHSVLWPRQIVTEIGGWDETLGSSQDLDIYVRALIRGTGIKKVAGGAAFYRQDNVKSVHHQPVESTIDSRVRFIRKMDTALVRQGQIHRYKLHIARLYAQVAYTAAFFDEQLSLQCERRARELAGFQAFNEGPLLHRIACYMLSFSTKEKLARRFAEVGIARKARKNALRQSSR